MTLYIVQYVTTFILKPPSNPSCVFPTFLYIGGIGWMTNLETWGTSGPVHFKSATAKLMQGIRQRERKERGGGGPTRRVCGLSVLFKETKRKACGYLPQTHTRTF